MNIKRSSQLLLNIALCLSLIVYFLNIYPSFIANLGKEAPLICVLFIDGGFLVSYFAFLLGLNMPAPAYMGLSLLLFVFFNLFLVVGKYSSYAPLGIPVILVFLIGILITNRKIREE
jgi:hypothetical protein